VERKESLAGKEAVGAEPQPYQERISRKSASHDPIFHNILAALTMVDGIPDCRY
jgi:hypothetical protein